jgi:hypothetical protein
MSTRFGSTAHSKSRFGKGLMDVGARQEGAEK